MWICICGALGLQLYHLLIISSLIQADMFLRIESGNYESMITLRVKRDAELRYMSRARERLKSRKRFQYQGVSLVKRGICYTKAQLSAHSAPRLTSCAHFRFHIAQPTIWGGYHLLCSTKQLLLISTSLIRHYWWGGIVFEAWFVWYFADRCSCPCKFCFYNTPFQCAQSKRNLNQLSKMGGFKILN